MNWHNDWLYIARNISCVATIIMVLANPFLENRRLALLTLIPLSVAVIIDFLLAAEAL